MKRESRRAIVALLLAIFCLQTFAANPTASSRLLPQKPNFARVSAVSPFEIDLNWRDRSNNGDGFQIERSTDRSNFRQIAQLPRGTTTYRDKNLFPGTRYFYRIRAFNASGTSRYSATSARTHTPTVPLSVAEWGYPLGVVTPTNADLVSISAGAFHGLGLKKDGTVIAWGYDNSGDTVVPTNLDHVIAISAGDGFSLALKNDGTVVEWGADGSGQMSPTNNLTDIVAISAGLRYSLALKNDGTVVAWGFDDSGDITPPPGLTGVVEIAAGEAHSLALKSDGTVVGWGGGFSGAGMPPTNLTSVIAIAAGSGVSMALKHDGTIVTWGSQTLTTNNLTDVTAIALGANQAVALKKDGAIFSWNLNFPPIATPDLSNSVVAVTANYNHFAALSTSPAAPANPFVTVLSANEVRLSWQDNSPDEKHFAIERTSYSDSGNIPWAQIAIVAANTTKFIDTTVQTGTTYTYRVRALGKFGTSPYCSEINVTLAPLATPDILSATLGSTNEVNLSWYDSFSGIDSFKIERAPDDNGAPGDWTEIASDTVSNFLQNSFTDSTALPNNIYWYRVRASNVLGFSDYSDPVSINVAPPPAPQYFNATTFADSVSLNWDYNPANQGFKIERAPDVNGGPGAWTQIALLDTSNGSQYTDRGLSLGTTYWYRLRAFNWTGDSDYAGPISVTVVPPAPPNPVYANVGATDGVDISWYPVINDEDGFKLERAPDVGGAPGVWTEIASFNDVHIYFESFHDTNVVANNTYWYRVRAFNLFGFSDYSTPVSVSLIPPPAPTLAAATSYAGSVNLQWQDNTPNLLAFKIERAPDADGTPGAWTQVAIVSGGASSYNDPNLTGGATYWYRIRAANWIGDSSYSGLTVVTIDPPTIPRIAFITLNSANGVDLTFSDTIGDEDGFLVERAVPTDLGFVNWTQVAKLDAPNFATVYFTDTNATPNATNWYRVRAFNSVGTSDYSPISTIAVVRPGPPFLIGGPTSNTVGLTWYDQDFAAEATLGYRVQRAPDAGGQPGIWTQIATINGGYFDYTYTDTGLLPGATYWYRVEAFNWIGDSDFSDPFSITITPPNPPFLQLVGLSITNHQVDLYWYDNASDEDVLTFERASDENGAPGAWSQIGTLCATNTTFGSFSDTNATAYTTNWYRVRAFNAAGASDYSAPVDIDIVPSSAPHIWLAPPFGNQITVSWYDSASGFDGVIGYKLERAPDINGNPGAWTQLINTTNSEYTDKNLAADTTYWYRIRSYNWVGDGDYTDPISATITPPMQPSNLFAALGATNTVLLQWIDYFLDKDGFKIERVADAGGYPGDAWQEIGTVSAPFPGQYSFVDTNVIANTTNWYRVRAFSVTGFSDYDGDAMVRVMPPDAPINLSASAYKNTVQLSWNGDFSIGEGGFVIQRALDAGGAPGTWTDIATTTEFDASYQDPGLSIGMTYWYRVRAFNWVGPSEYASPVSVTLFPVALPTKPDMPTAYMDATNQVTLFWYDDASDEDGFKVQHASDVGGAPGNWTEIGTVYTTNSYYAQFTDTNVTANSTNWYRVQAFNSVGFSEFSDSNSVAVIPPVAAPWMIPASVISAHRIDVRWQADYDFIQGYKIERAPDNGGAPGTWALLADLPSTDTFDAYSDITVVMNKQYWYRVQSYNWAGSSPYSDPLLVNDAPPPAPALTVANDQPNQFTLAWTRTSDDIASIKIERAPDNNGVPGAWIQIAEPVPLSGIVPTNYTDIGIPTGQTFWYRVRAVNAVGNSPYSNDASATEATPPLSFPTPAQILSLTTTNDGVLIQWSTAGGNTDVVQASGNFASGYTNISPALVIGGSGDTITNYFDAGALTNSPSRFYRIRSSR